MSLSVPIFIDYTKPTERQSGFTGVNLNNTQGPTENPGTEGHVESRTIARRADWLEDYLGRDVSRFFYRWGGSLSAVLARIRTRYDGDLDQFALHLVVVLTELACANAAAEARAKGAERVIVRRRGVNSQSLADISRIPRETVRRKLAAMADRGLVAREADGLWYPGPASDVDQFFYALSPLFWDGVRPG
jgi:hypothetical protein